MTEKKPAGKTYNELWTIRESNIWRGKTASGDWVDGQLFIYPELNLSLPTPEKCLENEKVYLLSFIESDFDLPNKIMKQEVLPETICRRLGTEEFFENDVIEISSEFLEKPVKFLVRYGAEQDNWTYDHFFFYPERRNSMFRTHAFFWLDGWLGGKYKINTIGNIIDSPELSKIFL